jgi:hypothetical protein
MRAVKLEVRPFSFISYLELECTKELNQHSVIRITGIIGQENSREYRNMALQETWVSIDAISENGNMKHFFVGILTELSDKEGVKVISNKDIVVQAERNIQIRSQKAGVNMAAETAILMQQGAAKVEINNDINISGGKIYMN